LVTFNLRTENGAAIWTSAEAGLDSADAQVMVTVFARAAEPEQQQQPELEGPAAQQQTVADLVRERRWNAVLF
jgi:hypothetical protein